MFISFRATLPNDKTQEAGCPVRNPLVYRAQHVYGTFSHEAKASIDLHTNQADVDSLTRYVSEVKREDEFLRDQSTEPFYTIYYWDVFFSKQKRSLESAMTKAGYLHDQEIPRSCRVLDLGVFKRQRSLSLVQFGSAQDHLIPENAYAKTKYYDLNGSWGCEKPYRKAGIAPISIGGGTEQTARNTYPATKAP